MSHCTVQENTSNAWQWYHFIFLFIPIITQLKAVRTSTHPRLANKSLIMLVWMHHYCIFCCLIASNNLFRRALAIRCLGIHTCDGQYFKKHTILKVFSSAFWYIWHWRSTRQRNSRWHQVAQYQMNHSSGNVISTHVTSLDWTEWPARQIALDLGRIW